MHPEQRQAIQLVAYRADKLTELIMNSCQCDEDTALEVIRETPSIVSRLQEEDLAPLLVEAVKKVEYKSSTYKPMPIPKHELHPEHPDFIPRITTKDTFNAHVAQAIAPYVKAIVDRVARDRELQPPDLKTIEAVLVKTDWARAAYEAKQMPPKPPPGKLHKFFQKYVFTPLDKVTDKVPIAHLWGTLGAAQILLILWTVLGGTLARLERAGAPAKMYNLHSKRQQIKMFKRLSKKSGIPWSGGGVY